MPSVKSQGLRHRIAGLLTLAAVLAACTGPAEDTEPLPSEGSVVSGPAAPAAGPLDGAEPRDVEELLALLADADLDHDALLAELYRGALAEGGTVVQYVFSTSPAAEQWVPAFEAAFPGMRLDYLLLRASDLLDRVLAEDAAGAMQVDVVMTSAPGMTVIEGQGILAPGMSALAPEAIDPVFVTEYAVSALVQPYVIAWNTERADFTAPPGSWDDLLDPDFQGCLISEGNPTWFARMIAERGEEGVRAWVRDLIANGGAFQAGTTAAARSAALASGEIPCIAAGTLGSFRKVQAQGAPIAWTIPERTPTVVYEVGVVRNTPRPWSAALLAAWTLGPEAARISEAAELLPTNGSGGIDPAFQDWIGPGGSLADRITVQDRTTVADLERRSSALVADLVAEFAG